MPRIANTNLDIFPLGLGTSIFGSAVDEAGALEVLDAYLEAGGNFIDTSDEYPRVRAEDKGTTEVLIGGWVRSRGIRDKVVVATKVGKFPTLQGLAPATIRSAVEASLQRLGFDYIDLYYAHEDDPDVPLEDTLATFDELVRQGKVRYIAASNYSAPRLAEALAISDRENLARFVALQPYYNMMEREYEAELQSVCAAEGLACIPYKSLAGGFLSGKYRQGAGRPDTAHDYVRSNAWGNQPLAYQDTPRGDAVVAALDEVAARHDAACATVAIAWMRSQPTVIAPLVSSRTLQQLQENVRSAALELSAEDITLLSAAAPLTSASAYPPVG